MTNVVIIGAGGRMGQTLIRCIENQAVPGIRLVGAVDLWDCPLRGQPAGKTGVTITSDLAAVAPEADVLIDFSAHHGTVGNAPRIAAWGKAWVIGTTGIGPEGRSAIEAAAQKVPIVWAPNMSLGINLLFALLEQAARALKGKGYDVEIIERHHRRKKDSPSGTALGLGQAVARGLDVNLDEVSVHGRHGLAAQDRPSQEIGFHAVRGGDIVGDHTVMFAADGEVLEFSHRATSRETFAIGALRAALWVRGRPPGLYSMRDVLGV
ncbi:MAG: 4-hydroxy-tetrahydrodipicolinate reductase [Kiritimatiellae bacterium]|nr:4-hydroxy-tetrahydrodipicolinate reductase [Kiritimatiellia bacterium]MDW8459465.1 4-hydroxy-tetrahydrodipicolinate reductase [Verrucomicrobiota bacterium]